MWAERRERAAAEALEEAFVGGLVAGAYADGDRLRLRCVGERLLQSYFADQDLGELYIVWMLDFSLERRYNPAFLDWLRRRAAPPDRLPGLARRIYALGKRRKAISASS